MSTWQPISTAPRDGTVIIVGDIDCGAFLMFWNAQGRNSIVQDVAGIWEAQGGGLTWSEAHGYGPRWWCPVDAPASVETLPPDEDEVRH